jgi:hypothetical protein
MAKKSLCLMGFRALIARDSSNFGHWRGRLSLNHATFGSKKSPYLQVLRKSRFPTEGRSQSQIRTLRFDKKCRFAGI